MLLILLISMAAAAVVAGVLLDFLCRRRSSRLPLLRQLQIYAILRLLDLRGIFIRRRFERTCRNFMQEQRLLISHILRANRDTRYGRDHKFATLCSLEEFRASHPVTTYSHYVPYIDAMKKGEESALFGDDDVVIFATSSGTTGSNKHLPVGRRQLRNFLDISSGYFAETERGFGGGGVGAVLTLAARPRSTTTPAGHRVGSLSSFMQRNVLSKLRSAAPLSLDTVELTATACCQLNLLFALGDEQLHALFCTFVQHFIVLMRTLETSWPILLHSLSTGKIDADAFQISDPEVLKNLGRQLTPAPERAMELRREFESGFEGILHRVWPGLRYVQAAYGGVTGNIYLQLARPYLGDVPILDMAYCSSESGLGVSMEPAAPVPRFTLLGGTVLYEFLPVGSQHVIDNPDSQIGEFIGSNQDPSPSNKADSGESHMDAPSDLPHKLPVAVIDKSPLTANERSAQATLAPNRTVGEARENCINSPCPTQSQRPQEPQAAGCRELSDRRVEQLHVHASAVPSDVGQNAVQYTLPTANPEELQEIALHGDSTVASLPVQTKHCSPVLVPGTNGIQPLLANQVQVGGEYELVLSTTAGLYRYRLGDVVRVCGFHHQAPVVEIRYREGQALNLQGEKVSELALHTTLMTAVRSWPTGSHLREFTAAESLLDLTSSGRAPHYLLFLEVDGHLAREHLQLVDATLQATLENYARYRASGTIAAIRPVVVTPGAFQRLREQLASRAGADWTQIKSPRVLSRPEDVALLLSCAVP